MSVDQPLISVIVPVYNVESYLRHCVDSIINQTYTNIEIILVNDGSTDSSGTICKEYAEKDTRIRYFEKENGGLSDARNYGIERSGGAYITFVDSDDWVDENYIATLYYKLKENDADIAIGNYFRFDMTDNMYYIHVHEYYERIWTRDEIIKALPLLEKSDASYEVSWGKLFKRKVLDNLYFPIGQLHEDTATTFKTYLKANKIIYLHQNLYVYRRRPNSITEDLTEKNYEDTFKAFEERIITLLLAGYDITPHLEDYKYKLQMTLEGLLSNDKLKNADITKRLQMLDTFRKD